MAKRRNKFGYVAPKQATAKDRTILGVGGVADSPEALTRRLEMARSGGHGVHADSVTRRTGTYRTNRVGSRSAQRAAAVRDAS